MQCDGEEVSLAVDYFTFSPSIADHLRSASLIISHAGKLLFIFDIRWMSGLYFPLLLLYYSHLSSHKLLYFSMTENVGKMYPFFLQLRITWQRNAAVGVKPGSVLVYSTIG